MKAIVRRAYGGPDVLRLEEAPAPVPGPGEVLVRVRAASLNAMDVHFLPGRPLLFRLFTGLTRPKDPRSGADLAGEVEAVGAGVTRFAPGDRVFGVARGAFAEAACAAEGKLAAIPDTVSFEQAATLPVAGVTALQGLRDAGQLRAGQKVLVVGAGGGVGSLAVQIARALGGEVTAVCGPAHVARLRAAGTERVIDYSAADFLAAGERYDLIFDLAGDRGFAALSRALTAEGRVVAAGIGAVGGLAGWAWRLAIGMLRSALGRRKLAFFVAAIRPADLALLAAMVEAGTLTPPVTRRYPLAEAAEATRAFLGGEAGGKIVLTV
jgi:NADPH:quinone reductase-like Zn-dependent oxidoreductase